MFQFPTLLLDSSLHLTTQLFLLNPIGSNLGYLARLHRQTLCYSKCVKMLENSLPLLIHYLKFKDVPVPYTFA
ncbi:hypothetical protein MICCA_500006 [Microcystis aeruginosa PCC 9432]|uniref:Uncharacterized protein n=1 Tax=Microcystis aeruginosa PCC 9432 TaxID=1160280 RepID=A0A830ZVY8_MICAE|nr:hypothetical protein MICCA_500006 [Microcystis aeruginosa PCC 9432]